MVVLHFEHLPANTETVLLELPLLSRTAGGERFRLWLYAARYAQGDSSSDIRDLELLRDIWVSNDGTVKEEFFTQEIVIDVPESWGPQECETTQFDITSFVQQVVPQGGSLSFLVGAAWRTWGYHLQMRSMESEFGGARLLTTHSNVRAPGLLASTLLEPAHDGTLHNVSLGSASGPLPLEERESLEATDTGTAGGPTASVFLQFDGLPRAVTKAFLLLHKWQDGGRTADGEWCFRSLDSRDDWYKIQVLAGGVHNRTVTPVVLFQRKIWVTPKHRLARLNITDLVQQYAPDGGTLSLLLSSETASYCASSFRSSRYIPSSHHGKVNARLSLLPLLDITHQQECGRCVFVLSPSSILRRQGDACNCTSLGFSNMALSGIGQAALRGLTELETLDLSNNNIKTLQSFTLRDLINLRELDLSSNLIMRIEDGAFGGMANLQLLWMQRNEIQRIGARMFSGLQSLHSLSLSNSQIEFIEHGAFDSLENVAWLDISSNKLVALDSIIWNSMPHLDGISLANNRQMQCIPSIPDSVSWVDLTQSEGEAVYFFFRPLCTAFGCPRLTSPQSFEEAFSPATAAHFWSLVQSLHLIRSDVSESLDAEHLRRAMYVSRADGVRCSCSGSSQCAVVREKLKGKGAVCAVDSDCDAGACCNGLCGDVLHLDHRGPRALCTTCTEPGTFWDGGPCLPCRAGSWSQATGLTDSAGCVLCPGGTASFSAGATDPSACEPCGHGSFSAPGSALCTPCRRGEYQDEVGQAECLECGPGEYQDEEGQTACKACTAPEFSEFLLSSGLVADTCPSMCFPRYSGPSCDRVPLVPPEISLAELVGGDAFLPESVATVTVAFSDPSDPDRHTLEFDWSCDSSAQASETYIYVPDVDQWSSSVAVYDVPTPGEEGPHTLCVTVRDGDSLAATVEIEVVIRRSCVEDEGAICHGGGFCTRTVSPASLPSRAGIINPQVTWPSNSDKKFTCGCASEQLGHGWGPDGCANTGYVVRVVYGGRVARSLLHTEVEALLALLGDLHCSLGAAHGCDHIHYTTHARDLGVNVLFSRSPSGLLAANEAARSFNAAASASPSLRRSSLAQLPTPSFPPEVQPEMGARVYAWDAGTTGSPVPVLPSGMEVGTVIFEPGCGLTGCVVLHVLYSTGSRDGQAQKAFNTFYLPYAVGNDRLSWDYGYTPDILDTFEPATFPCRVSDYVASDGAVESLPVRATGCCFGTPFDSNSAGLGGDGTGTGLLGKYRATVSFAGYASFAYGELCPGGDAAPAIETSGPTASPKPQDRFPDGSTAAGNHTATSFLAPGSRFVDMPDSPGITFSRVRDPFVGMFACIIKLDERELRKKAGLLRGTVGIEHSVDFFLGFANFKTATGSWILDSLASQTAIHVEKTSFFSVSTHGTNDYSFIEYINLRLVAVYTEDNFLGELESAERTTRTNSSAAAHYVQVTFTLGVRYGINSNSGLIPLDSVRAGRGSFFDAVEVSGGLHPKCLEYTDSPANEFGSLAVISKFDARINQPCGPAASMCVSPTSVVDHFVVFNIPLGFDFFPEPSEDLSTNVFVHFVVSAVDDEARTATGSQSAPTSPNDGEDPWQQKTTLTASIPVVSGGINIFCDGITAKTDLKDVADIDVVVGSASSSMELTRLRILKGVVSTQLDVEAPTQIDSDSIEAGLLTLLVRGNSSYFDLTGNSATTIELEDVITIHVMDSDEGRGEDAPVATEVLNLLRADPDDNSISPGLDTDGYCLNGAVCFTIDRSSKRAHLSPSPALLEKCPFNPPRPAPGNTPLVTCVTRRDVRFRGYPARAGAVSTAMELCAGAGSCAAELTEQYTPGMAFADMADESKFFSTVLGASDYAHQLALDYALAIDAEYGPLNDRFSRAFWINPGYEWTPTQTGGTRRFSLSQKLFLLALAVLDEGFASDAGEALSEPGPTFGPNRRMLLTADTALKQEASGAVGNVGVAYDVRVEKTMAAAFGSSEDRVLRLKVEVQLSTEEACMAPEPLQAQLRQTLDVLLAGAASEFLAVQVTALKVDAGGEMCASARREQDAAFSAATAEVKVLVVFVGEAQATFNKAVFSTMSGINAVEVLSGPGASSIIIIDEELVPDSEPRPIKTQKQSEKRGSSNGMLIMIIGSGIGSVVVVVTIAAYVWVRRRRSAEVFTRLASDASSSELVYSTYSSPAGSQLVTDAVGESKQHLVAQLHDEVHDNPAPHVAIMG